MATTLLISYNIMTIIVCAITVIFQLLLLSTLFYRLHFSESQQTVLKSIKYSVISFYFSLSIAYLMLMLSRIVYLNDMESDSWLPFWTLFISFGGFTLVAVYISVIARLYETFKGTIYAIKMMTIYIHSICAFIVFLVLVSVVVVGQLEDAGYHWINLMVAVLMIAIGLTHLMYLFNHYLFQQVLSERRCNRKYRNTNTKTKIAPNSPVSVDSEKDENIHTMRAMSIELDHSQLELLRAIRKHTLLSFMIIGSFLIGTLTPWLIIFCQNDLCDGIFWNIWWALHCIAINSAGLIMYLGFSVNRQNYNSLCKICDHKCESFCKGLAKKRLKASDHDTYHD